MERSSAVVWTCLLGVGLTLALPPGCPFNSSNADPRLPQLIGCVFQHRDNVTCRWKAGNTPTTDYTLQVHLMIANKKQHTFTCTTSDTSCTAKLDGATAIFCFCITVTAHGHNQNITSHPRCQSGRTQVMLSPVTLKSSQSVSGRPRCLAVTWSYIVSDFPLAPFEIKDGDLKSQMEFTAQGEFNAQVETVDVRNNSFLVCLFRPDTLYTVRLRHRYMGPESPWSPWSNACQGRTGEDAPSAAPAFWRRVKQTTDENGWRFITLLWKPLPHYLSNGRVLFFNVSCQTESAQVLIDYGSCKDLHHMNTSCSLLLPAGRWSCALKASNSAGTSPEARIWLRGASETEPPAPRSMAAKPLGDSGLDVRWTAPVNWSTSGFVVEWFAFKERNSGILHWERLNSSCTALVITEGIKRLERYSVSVRALYGQRGAGRNTTVHMYTRQGAPSAGPKVVVQQISGSRVELIWSPVPVELLHGFIRNYTIYYTTVNQPARRVTVPGHTLRYSLENLSPGNYDIFMKASTDAGAGAAGPIANVHIGSEEIWIVMYAILPLILTFLVLVLMACLAQNKMVKQKLCQDIPDPSNSTLVHWMPKSTLEGMRHPPLAEQTETKYSDVILLGEIELLNADSDQDISYQRCLQTSSSHRYCPLPVSGDQTPQDTSKSEKCFRSLSRAKKSSNTDLSSCLPIYSNDLISQTVKCPPSPLPSCSNLPSNAWQHSTVSVNDVKFQQGGDSEPSVSLQARSTTSFDSPLSQTDELKTFRLFLKQHQSTVSSHSSCILLSHPSAEVTSPQHPYSQSLYNLLPSLQPNTFTQLSDTFNPSFTPFPHSVFVDFSYCPVQCDPYISLPV
ncbi:interleukin-6 receptor subunit beta [Etheostoma cragini]|uniref:interleukin-6 receptor subunit beta n=1 Tax=Etheostoma cragini TaxID=417921 RepID=UPI00155F4CC6|nr:interleukin-6 receptor subunit beta [Etheostoma cragini]